MTRALPEGAFIFRHPEKEKGPDPSITEVGRQTTVEVGKEILAKKIESLPEGTIVALMGVSANKRTREGMHAVADGLAQADNGFELIRSEEVRSLGSESVSGGARELASRIEAEKDKKFVIELPLHLNELDQNSFLEENESGRKVFLKYFMDKLEENGYDDEKVLFDWLEDYASGQEFNGPDPNVLADETLESIKRVYSFLKGNLSQERPIVVGIMGHAWGLDALYAKLMNNGVINQEAIVKLRGHMVSFSELASIEFHETEDGKVQITLEYNKDRVNSEIPA